MKKILVVSHERSGTHFLINTIAFNFSQYSNIQLDFPENEEEFNQFVVRYTGKKEKRIFKSHHQQYVFQKRVEKLFDDYEVFYIIRDGRDVLASCWKYFNNHPQSFPVSKTLNELLKKDPGTFKQDKAYNFVKTENMVDRWAQHVESWLFIQSQITIIKYEDLYCNFEHIIRKIASQLNLKEPLSIIKPTCNDRCVFPNGGGIRKWKECFSIEDENYFWDKAKNLMNKLEYQR